MTAEGGGCNRRLGCTERLREYLLDESGLALHVRIAILGESGREGPFEFGILADCVWVCAEEVAKGDVPVPQRAATLDEVKVKRRWITAPKEGPTSDPQLAHVDIARLLERLDAGNCGRLRRMTNKEINDGFRTQA